jgi:hypothetical protein
MAEQYLDGREEEWIAWPVGLHSGVACVSCHTGLPYLAARPAQRQALNEKSSPTFYEAVQRTEARRAERWFDAGAGRLHCLPWEADTGVK